MQAKYCHVFSPIQYICFHSTSIVYGDYNAADEPQRSSTLYFIISYQYNRDPHGVLSFSVAHQTKLLTGKLYQCITTCSNLFQIGV